MLTTSPSAGTHSTDGPAADDLAAHDRAWLIRRPRKDEPRLRLFCFHHGGGDANSFLPWSALLPPDVEVVGVQLPGRGLRRREPPLTDPLALLRALGPVLARATQGAPFAFFGHSVGAWLAFEMARHLAAARLPGPRHLFVSGRAAPHLPFRLEAIDALPDMDMIAALQRFGGVDDALLAQPALVRLFLPVIRADLCLHRSHHHAPGEPLACPITAIVADDDPLCRVDDAAAWGEHTRAGFELKVFTGGHFFFHRRPQPYIAGFFAALASV